jgi:hypothetical protein
VSTKACTADVPANVLTEDVCLANVAGNLTNLLIFAENYNVLRIMSGIRLGINNVTRKPVPNSELPQRIWTCAFAEKQWKRPMGCGMAVAA